MTDTNEMRKLLAISGKPPVDDPDSFECAGCSHLLTRCRCDEKIVSAVPSLLAELDALRARVGWLDHLDTPEGRAMHATEAVLVDNEQLRADLREAMELLDMAEAPPDHENGGDLELWNRRRAVLRGVVEKRKETP